MAEIPPISGFSTAARARVVLLQSGQLVHAPAAAIGLQPLDTTLSALAGLDAAAGFMAQTSADGFAKRTLTGTASKIAVTNGTGAAGDPTITIPDAVTLVTPTITGLLTLSGGRVAFPATQVASADPNTLDDYEEGTFTPVVVGLTTAGAGTYTTQSGKYTKIGRAVLFSIEFAWSAHTGTGNIQVGGLPFTAGNTTAVSVLSNGLSYPSSMIVAQCAVGTTVISLFNSSGTPVIGAIPMDTSVAALHIAGMYVV